MDIGGTRDGVDLGTRGMHMGARDGTRVDLGTCG